MVALADPISGIGHMLSHPFLRSAFVAGTGIALAAGLIGYFVVLRGQVFTGDALSHVAFTGALAALVLGFSLRAGLYGACIVFALVMAALGRRARADDAVVGSVFAWVVGLGALLLTVYTTSSSGVDATAGISVLFGSILGLSSSAARTDAVVAVAVAAAIVVIARPLLFATVDETVAAAQGVGTRRVGVVFLVLVGITAGEASQAVGALLLLGLLAAPAGAAQLLTARPFRALALSAAIALLSTWVGLCASYAFPRVPPSFGILAAATGCYGLAAAWRATRDRLPRRRISQRA